MTKKHKDGNDKRCLLEAYKTLYKEDSNAFIGAVKVSDRLKLSEEERGSHHGGVHYLLKQLKEEGYLKSKKGYGFRLNPQKTEENTNIKKESNNKKAYDKGWHKRNAEVFKALKKIQTDIDTLIRKLKEGWKLN